MAKDDGGRKAIEKYSGPPSWYQLGSHDVFPEANHDEIARYDFLTQLNNYLSSELLPGVKSAYEKNVKPAIEKQTGTEPTSRHQVHAAMKQQPQFQVWSALRRNTMEMRQQAGREQVIRQWQPLIDKVKSINDSSSTLKLNPETQIPRYVSENDTHCMPGNYQTEYCEDDVLVAASYDAGLFVTTAGLLGKMSDGGGQAAAEWFAKEHPEFKPKRILDIGCTMGHNTLPLGQAFPEAEVIAVDVGAPMLRYANARAKSMGVNNVTFMQANAEELDFPDGHFDLIMTSMFWHETPVKVMSSLFKKIENMLAVDGITIHLEQPQYPGMDVYEQFIRDWDSFYNNEPYWSKMHDVDLEQLMEQSGFKREHMFQTGLLAVIDEELYPELSKAVQEDYGRCPKWNAFGAWKKA